jgi:hypothetical protein
MSLSLKVGGLAYPLGNFHANLKHLERSGMVLGIFMRQMYNFTLLTIIMLNKCNWNFGGQFWHKLSGFNSK